MKSETVPITAAELSDRDESIYQALITAIVEQQLPPGSKLPEEALAEIFGVSRTGIRKVLQRLAAVQMIVLTPKRGAQVAMPSVEEARDIFHTRSLIECANLPAVLARCQSTHLVALEKLNRQEQQAHAQHDGPAAIRHSAAFHVQLQAIAGNRVLTEMVMRLTQRSSLVIAAYGAPWQQGCRCDDHDRLIKLVRKKDPRLLADAMRQHFTHIVESLHFERSGEALPDFARIFAGFAVQLEDR
ncbi:GntR family transcriptional regulator [Erwinia psidii]|uniref:GntR family transcriptional regulator n=1 Tax=Erwinia psidii TaxID=69224 RepID=A0A3N6S9J3_9GAMM|nr:GntR family transcriptional regulator [Erwinia psidii]MCX8959226.1 GntR family transcriptional regulator [Erwinia psidii]MCX8966002.1 GntR family transcriptional regulator [Erwinia psidii]RQM36653.1 GntR family transcriptional regulator [Erwinia psidii]